MQSCAFKRTLTSEWILLTYRYLPTYNKPYSLTFMQRFDYFIVYSCTRNGEIATSK